MGTPASNPQLHHQQRPYPGDIQRHPRRDLPPILGGGWFRDIEELIPHDAPNVLAQLVQEYAPIFRDAIGSSLATNSRNTYRTGQNALIQFSAQTGITANTLTNVSPENVCLTFRTFAIYLRNKRKIKSNTIDQYITHCKTTLTQQSWHGSEHIRSPLLTMLLRGWHRQDILLCPARLTASIPATASVMEVFFQVASARYASNPRLCAEVKASAAATFYLALRSAEGASASSSTRDSDSPDSHHMRADKAFFRFPNDNQFYLAAQGTVFPANKIPTSFDFLQDTSKNTMDRGSAHRGAHRNPNPTGKPFDVVLILWDYVTRFPPPSTGAFFPNITTTDLTTTMQQTANHPSIALDPHRLTTRCMRSGSVTMLRNMKNKLIHQRDLETIRDHGNWAGDIGAAIYSHDSPDAEQLVKAPSLYDNGFMTPHYLRWFYMTPM